MEGRGFRSVCVVGGGLVAHSAALGFARALPHSRVSILAVPDDPAALADRLPGTLPTVHLFHARIGLDELDLVGSGAATHRLGTRFDGWSADGAPWYHIFGEFGRSAGSLPFHQAWLRARRAGRARPFHFYATAAALAADGKFVHPAEDPQSLLSTYLYALRLDPGPYRERLAAEAAKLPRDSGEIGGIERREDDGIAALLLTDGRRIEADLYVDCAGPAAPLLSALDPVFEDWSAWLPCDRLSLASAAGAPGSCDVVAAEPAGWRWSSPLSGRLFGGRAYASAFDSDPDEESVTIRPGRRPRPWVRNVLAVGDAATAVDPLQQTNLHLAHGAILRALELMPGRDCHPLELAEYNRRTALETLRVRDFLALHYLRSGRSDGALWQALAATPPPDSLAHTLEQFEARGRLPFYEEETFDKDSWVAVLLGMGVLPSAPAAVALGLDEEQAAAAMERLASEIGAAARAAPPYADYLTRMTTPRRR